ncbi:YL1 nuclear protein-domain-containing protein, partial [Lophiotrema nucula]
GSEGESEPEAPQDFLAVSRARRSNAGNRMSTLLAQAAEEEQWGEEWEEAPNEEEFVGDEANDQDDFNMESSSSEDEAEGGDEDAGEKELRKAERQERIKKRKPATNPFAARLAAARKRVKLDVPSTESPAAPELPPRPKKKSERASWIPTEEDGPVRMSARKQTVANKEHTMAKLKEKDKKRDDTLAMMKAAEARKAKNEPKTMSQAERLAEANRTERVNSKSLHRWEEAEELRAAERQAKLDALKNRQIEGPFIRYYSGPAIWIDDKLKFTGKGAPKVEDLDEKLNRAVPEVSEFSPESKHDNSLHNGASPLQLSQIQDDQRPVSQGVPYSNNIMFGPPQNPTSFLSGVEQYATPHNVTSQSTAPDSQNVSRPPTAQSPTQHHNQYDLPQASTSESQDSGANSLPPYPPFPQPHIPDPHQLPPLPFDQPHPSLSDPSLSQNNPTLAQFQKPPAPPKPPTRKVIRKALRNLLILSSFPQLDDPAPTRSRTTASLLKEKDKSALVQLSMALFGWSVADATSYVNSMLNAPKTKKAEREKDAGLPGKKKELCAVTNAVARYRDPETGIAYRDSRAFSVLRGVVGGGFMWCGALGCYVGGRVKQRPNTSGSGKRSYGLGVKPAHGVPKRFLEMSMSSSPPAAASASTMKSATATSRSQSGGENSAAPSAVESSAPKDTTGVKIEIA